jgi:hypothetical protein
MDRTGAVTRCGQDRLFKWSFGGHRSGWGLVVEGLVGSVAVVFTRQSSTSSWALWRCEALNVEQFASVR